MTSLDRLLVLSAATRPRCPTCSPTPASRYIDGGDPIVLASARRHGVADEDMLHAYRNPVRVYEFDDLTMLIGADAAGRVLEIGMATAEGIEFIVHAMPAREKFL